MAAISLVESGLAERLFEWIVASAFNWMSVDKWEDFAKLRPVTQSGLNWTTHHRAEASI
jgi:hypothetical protein